METETTAIEQQEKRPDLEKLFAQSGRMEQHSAEQESPDRNQERGGTIRIVKPAWNAAAPRADR